MGCDEYQILVDDGTFLEARIADSSDEFGRISDEPQIYSFPKVLRAFTIKRVGQSHSGTVVPECCKDDYSL